MDYCRGYEILNIYKHIDNIKDGVNTNVNHEYCQISISMTNPLDFDTSLFLRRVYYPNKTEMNCSSYEKYFCLNSFLGIVQVSGWRYNARLPNSICAKCLQIEVYNQRYDCTDTVPTIHLVSSEVQLESLDAMMRVTPQDFIGVRQNDCPYGSMLNKQRESCIPATSLNMPPDNFSFMPLWDTLSIQSKTLHCLFRLNGSLWSLIDDLAGPFSKISSNDSTLKDKHYKKLAFKSIKIPYSNIENIRVNETRNNSKIYASLQADNFIVRLYGFEPQLFYFQNRVCISARRIENYDLTKTCNVVYNNNIFNISENVTYWVKITHNNDTASYAAFCTKFLPLPNCTLTKIGRSLINIIRTNVYVKNRKGYKLLRTGEFFPLPDGLAMCISAWDENKYRWYEALENSKKIVSIICLCLSFVMETALITTYLKLNEYRTIHGKNMLSLCFSLLICDLMIICFFISAGIPQNVCELTAVILHFFALALSAWSAVIAFDLWFKFNSLFSAKTSKSLFYKYNLVGWGIPLLAILVCLTLEKLSNEVIGYGRDSQCFVSNPLAKLFSYVLPTIIIMAISIALLIFMMRKLRRDLQSRYKVSAVNNASPNLIKMSVKLCLAIGVAELLGIIQIPLSHENEIHLIMNAVFGFLYALVRSLRGCFIFVSFMTTEKMKKHFRRFVKCEKYSKNESL